MRKGESSIAFILGISHHKMVSNYQHKDEDAKKIGEEAQILIVNHLPSQ